jgi:uncharacterized membrane protein YbhN (UPF0104 family)
MTFLENEQMSVPSFVVYGGLLSLMLWISQRHKWKLWIRSLLTAIVLLTLAFLGYALTPPITLSKEEAWYARSPWLETSLFAFMLAGMASRYLTKAVEERRDKIIALKKQGSRFKKPKIEFDIWEFSYPLFVSGVTYGALLTQIKSRTLSLANATLSFQTGFFWQTVLAIRQERDSAQPKNSSGARKVKQLEKV